MPKTKNKCWSCGQDTMKPYDEVDHGWLRCLHCGATHLPNPTQPGVPAILVETWIDGGGEHHHPPSVKRLQKARARKA